MWLKLDDRFASNPRLRKLGLQTAWFHLCGQLYCATHLTDGRIDEEELAAVESRWIDDPVAEAKNLVEAGFWRRVDGGYEIVGYLEDQWSRSQYEAHQEGNRKRVRRHRERKRNAVTPPVTPTGNAVTHPVSNSIHADRTGQDGTGHAPTETSSKEKKEKRTRTRSARRWKPEDLIHEETGERYSYDPADETLSRANGEIVWSKESEELWPRLKSVSNAL
jgi:hypothetical protein